MVHIQMILYGLYGDDIM
ncbi:unnamed protein product, partial [Rotaria sp. Silwood2]